MSAKHQKKTAQNKSKLSKPNGDHDKTKFKAKRHDPIEDIVVTVDSCAELGGQPYPVLEKLKALYDKTGVRKSLTVIDTEQGFHEKSNCTAPEFVEITNTKGKYVEFLKRNPEWTKIVQTDTCRKFHEDFANVIVPEVVRPLMQAAQAAEREIQKRAYEKLKASGTSKFHQKRVKGPSQMPVYIYGDGEGGRFDQGIIDEAANEVRENWTLLIGGLQGLNTESKKFHKGFMADMIKATQKFKALSYAISHECEPDHLKTYKALPHLGSEILGNLDTVSHIPHEFSEIDLPDDEQWWKKTATIQALRLTKLWPWAMKGLLSDDAKEKLDSIHSNTADTSYLKLIGNVLPKEFDSKKTMHVLLTHDGPLIGQCLECTTGVKKELTMTKKQAKKAIREKQPLEFSYKPSNIYHEFGLMRRNPNEYPLQRALVGSEFCEFVYKEVLASLRGKIDKETLSEAHDFIRSKSATRPGQTVYDHIVELVEKADVPEDHKITMKELLEETLKLEEQVRKDVQTQGIAEKEGGTFAERRNNLLRQRAELGIRARG